MPITGPQIKFQAPLCCSLSHHEQGAADSPQGLGAGSSHRRQTQLQWTSPLPAEVSPSNTSLTFAYRVNDHPGRQRLAGCYRVLQVIPYPRQIVCLGQHLTKTLSSKHYAMLGVLLKCLIFPIVLQMPVLCRHDTFLWSINIIRIILLTSQQIVYSC